jgi:hypothetical protein
LLFFLLFSYISITLPLPTAFLQLLITFIKHFVLDLFVFLHILSSLNAFFICISFSGTTPKHG